MNLSNLVAYFFIVTNKLGVNRIIMNISNGERSTKYVKKALLMLNADRIPVAFNITKTIHHLL